MRKKEYTKVWGDTVYLPELTLSAMIGIAITMGLYLLVRYILLRWGNVAENMVNGYALIGGIVGCFISGIVTSRSFRPKRAVIEGTEQLNLEEILMEAESSIEIEKQALSKEDKEVILEMENLELYSLLSLMPEDSIHFKPEYKEFMRKEK